MWFSNLNRLIIDILPIDGFHTYNAIKELDAENKFILARLQALENGV